MSETLYCTCGGMVRLIRPKLSRKASLSLTTPERLEKSFPHGRCQQCRKQFGGKNLIALALKQTDLAQQRKISSPERAKNSSDQRRLVRTGQHCLVCGGEIVSAYEHRCLVPLSEMIIGPGGKHQFGEVFVDHHCEDCGNVYAHMPTDKARERLAKKKKRY